MIVDWSGAPEDCIGALVAKVKNSHFPKVTFAKSVIHEPGRVRGESCEGTELCAYLDMWVWEDRPWTGEGLPPVGTVCRLSGPTERLAPLHPEWAGREVKIYSQFVSDNGTKMAAYVSENHQIGGVGIAEMFLPVRTPEQIAADERASDIKEMVGACPYPGSSCTVTDCTALYDAGYRKQVSE